ncbi:MAG: phenylacetate--CoA ligase family protein [Candidatus Thorarchaeota archaeon]
MRKALLKLALQLRSRNIYAEFKWLKERCTHSLESNLALQEKKLKSLLLHSWKNVPYYSEQLEEAGVVGQGEIHLNKFQELSPLTRNLLQSRFSDLKSQDSDYERRKPYVGSSGGSTGQPVKFIQDRVYWTKSNAVKWLFFSFASDYPCKTLSLWGSERDILRQSRGLQARIGDFLLNRRLLNSFRMNQGNIPEYIQEINYFRPEILEAYVQSIYELSRFAKINGIGNIHKPNGIITAAGTLYPSMRETIESTFDTRVYNRYGTREVGDLACSCTFSDNLHLDVFNNFVEILDKNLEPCAPGEVGQVHVTTLNNLSMPLIRYNLGDLATPANPGCKCGRGLPTLASVEGRKTSIIRTRTGGIVPAEFFIHFVGVVFNKGFIERFQIIQEDYDELRIKIVLKNEERFLKEKPAIESAIKEVMTSECNIKWEFVEDIPALHSGKYVYVMSKISSE